MNWETTSQSDIEENKRPYNCVELKLGKYYHKVVLHADSVHREFDLLVGYIQLETNRFIIDKSVRERGLSFDELQMIYTSWSNLKLDTKKINK